ncbi:MAG: hypothetical protein ACHBN1_16275 [Heteroscytonema crispum UTEX LB 1556]
MGTGQVKKALLFFLINFTTIILIWLSNHWLKPVIALPPPEDIPEEILRTEIIIEARSPVDGKRLSAAEYAELQVQLRSSPAPQLNSNVRQTVFLLRLRRTLLQLFPFLNF